ncbi:MAG: glutathione S-transferase family protein [Alphaproteobacteria bacterium]|nr:glutathione S-transferase family protein [Alphaproteobacteria bacterium]
MARPLPPKEAPLTLHGRPGSGNAYKPALFMALAGIPFAARFVAADAQRTPEFLKLSPFGQVPVLQHGDLALVQSPVILKYLAQASGKFGPTDPVEALEIDEWLCFEQDLLFPGIGIVRFMTKLMQPPGDPAIVAWLRARGERALGTLERHLAERRFVLGDRCTVADIALYGYGRLAEEAGYDMASRPRTAAWRRSIEALPGWKPPQDLIPAK